MRMTLLNMVFSSVSFGLSAVCGTCLPNGCAVATHSQGDSKAALAREFGISRDTLYRYVPVKKRRVVKLAK